jgi:fructose-specific phosphotransferase system component IIB
MHKQVESLNPFKGKKFLSQKLSDKIKNNDKIIDKIINKIINDK